MTIVLGIESTAHTLGVGITKTTGNKTEIVANAVDKVPHTKKGFVPRLMAEHHARVFKKTVKAALEQAGIKLNEVDGIAFSQGPGMGHCLHVGFMGAKTLASSLGVPLLPVNHAVAHCEIGRWENSFRDPLVLYVSGGNTQILVRETRHYRVLGETLDVGVGNFLDVFARNFGLNNAVEVMQHASKASGELIELPYSIKGMNVSFSGMLTHCARDFGPRVKSGEIKLDDLCYSVQETVFAILTEASERALVHSGKKELLVCGGVACNDRLKEMLAIMAKANHVRFGPASNKTNVDNGAMISLVGARMLDSGFKEKGEEPFPIQRMRVEVQELTW